MKICYNWDITLAGNDHCRPDQRQIVNMKYIDAIFVNKLPDGMSPVIAGTCCHQLQISQPALHIGKYPSHLHRTALLTRDL